MKLKITIILVLLLHASLFFAQEYSFKNYDWDQKTLNIEIPEQYSTQNEVTLSKIVKIELALVGNVAKQYYLLHDKVYINSDDAIERNNKIYIPFSANENILINKARVILKDGKIITLNNKDIKEEIDEEKGVKYSYFAVNGLEKGAIIEKILVLEENPEIDGNTIKMQDKYPIAKLSFELIAPEHLVFKTKSYNGLSEAIIDEKKYEKKIAIVLNEKNIDGLDDDQTNSNWKTALKMFRYKLDANLISKARNLYNFKSFSTNLFDRVNPEYDKKQLKSIDEFCQTIPKSTNLQDQIWNIENKIKKTITYSQYIDSKESISEIFKTKQANQSDLLKLYTAIFKNFKIENNIVFTSNRYKIPFDKEFESYENLDELLFNFPTIKKFITPTEAEYRIPLIPAYLANNNGLFIKSKLFAGVSMGIGEINFIEIPGSDVTLDTMDIIVDFTQDLANPIITNKLLFGGYSAFNFQPIKDYTSAEEYKNVLKSIAKNYTVQTEFKTLETENDGIENLGKNPFLLKVTFDGKDLIQKAGENYLFSIGQVIGKQSELYQETKRTLPVEMNYPHAYQRTIKIILPKLTTVKNLEKLIFDIKAQINTINQAAFISNYSQKDNIITITNSEYYNQSVFPLSSFEDYRKVINAAADFNKIVIILSK